jgi:hypothetical protein
VVSVRTKHGRVVTDADLERMAEEAEAGYDLATLVPHRGRPPLGRSATGEHAPRLVARVPVELRDQVAQRAAAEGKTVSEVMRALLQEYVDRAPSRIGHG